MATIRIGSGSNATGTIGSDFFILEPLTLTSAVLTDPGGNSDTLLYIHRRGIFLDQVYQAGKSLFFVDTEGHQLRVALNPDGSAPIERFWASFVLEEGYPNPRLETFNVVAIQNFTEGGSLVYGTSRADIITAPTIGSAPEGASDAISRIFGGAGDDQITGSNLFDADIYGGRGNDQITGFVHSMLYGGDGSDVIKILVTSQAEGGGGDDKIMGGTSASDILGGFGNDTLVGGSGQDDFIFAVDETGQDKILDYGGHDRLIFQDTTSADVRFRQMGSDVVIHTAIGAVITVRDVLIADLLVEFV